MEQVAEVLLRFPPPGQDIEQLTDDAFDKQIKIHALHIQNLFRDFVQVIAANATSLLDVCLFLIYPLYNRALTAFTVPRSRRAYLLLPLPPRHHNTHRVRPLSVRPACHCQKDCGSTCGL